MSNNDRKIYLASLPRKRTAAGIMLFNSENKVLVLKLGYNEYWNFPGGAIEKGESIMEGLEREIMEEIGIKCNIVKCLVIEDKIEEIDDYLDECLQFIYLGEELSEKDIKNIKIDNDEITDYKFVDISEAIELVNPKMSKRLKYLNGNYNDCITMKNGDKVL